MHLLCKMTCENKKDKSIQILRFIAAMGIIIYHSGIAKGGYFGVDIFFIISGYVMMLSTEKGKNEYFLRKRLLRIVPLYWIATLVMYGLIYIIPSLSIMSEAKIEYLIKSLLFIPFINSKGHMVPILSIGWTLNYEIYFYIIFGISIKISQKYRMYYSASIIIVLSILGGVSNNFYLSYLGDSIMLEFLLGMILYKLQKHIKKKEIENFGIVLPLGASVAIWGGLWYTTCVKVIEERWIVLGVPAFVLCFVFMNCKKDILPEFMTRLGDMTYSVYIVEFFTTAIYKVICLTIESMLIKIVGLIVAIVCTYAIAMLSYKIVEKDIFMLLRQNLIEKE